MPYKYCQHVKENGIFCGSAALRGRRYCYYHARERARQLAMAKAAAQKKPWRINIPPLENMHAVQIAIQQVTEALAAEAIDPHRAGLMLYALQQAANNVRQLGPWLLPSVFEVHEDADLRAIDYPGLEEEFELPKRIDLDARPEELFPPPEPQARPELPGTGEVPTLPVEICEVPQLPPAKKQAGRLRARGQGLEQLLPSRVGAMPRGD